MYLQGMKNVIYEKKQFPLIRRKRFIKKIAGKFIKKTYENRVLFLDFNKFQKIKN